MVQTAPPRTITPVTWIEAPCYISGWDRASMLEIVAEGGVDLNDDGQIEKESLYEFLECVALVLHWND